MTLVDDVALGGLRSLAEAHRISTPAELSPVQVVEGLLGPADREAVFESLVDAHGQFVSNEEPGRRALVLTPPPAALTVLAERLAELTPVLAARLGLDPDTVVPPPLDALICSAHGHGDFLAPHYDVADPDAEPTEGSRVLTLVYHLFRAPIRFEGGALRIYDRRVIGGRSVSATSFVDLPRRDDILYAYRPTTRHEVTTVRMEPEASFADRRFAVASFATHRA